MNRRILWDKKLISSFTFEITDATTIEDLQADVIDVLCMEHSPYEKLCPEEFRHKKQN